MFTNKYQLFIGMIFFLWMNLALAQTQRVTLSGYVKDASSGEALIGAAVQLQSGQGVYSNEYGFFSLTVPKGPNTLKISYIGYQSLEKALDLQTDMNLSYELENIPYQTDEVVISAEAEDKNVKSVESPTKLQISEIKQMPQFLGEVDVIRSIQLLPGVTTVGEGATGFNVRGGNIDQNLILLDEAPVYNSSHLFGFFSVFNADALKDVQLFKGGIPAKYGGRLSSVLDVRQKEGNMKKFSGAGGIGILSSRLTLETPIVKDKGSFMVAGRRSYMDLFLGFSKDTTISGNSLYFYDLNVKANYQLSERDRVFLSGYWGNDVFGFQDLFQFRWGNATATLRWNHLFNDKLFSNFTAIYSDYEYLIGVPTGLNAFDWTSNIINTNLKADLGYFPDPNNTLEFGASAIYYRFKPGNVDFKSEENGFQDFILDNEQAVESAAYLSHEWKAGNRLTVKYGARYSLFQSLGKTNVFVYEDGVPLSEARVIDTLNFASGEVIETYGGFEPRISINFLIDQSKSIKASYNRTRQYVHLISNTTTSVPTDIWKPAGKYIKPAIADQVSLGYFQNLAQNKYEVSAEVYYKNFQNLIDYVDGADLLFNDQLETQLLNGKGRAYGFELMVRKQKGKLTGWIGYTLARTERQVDQINQSEWYPANWDKMHDISVVGAYELNPRWTVSANFAFMSGRPVTYPDARYGFDGIIIPNYSNRNGARMPTYHRLDLSADYHLTTRKKKGWEHSLNIGVYNVYARRNPFSISFRQNEDNPTVTEAVRLSIFGTVIPSVTYNFSF